MPAVIVHDKESFEVAMRRFKRAVERAGVITEMRMRTATKSRPLVANG